MAVTVLVDLSKLKDLYTGLGQVSLHFGKTLLAIKPEDIDFTFLIPPGFEKEFGDRAEYVHPSFFKRYFSRTNKSYDLWHAVHQDSPFMPHPDTPYLLTIHDLNFLEEKSSFKARQRLNKLQRKVNRASHLTAISNYTANIVCKNLQTKNKPLSVVYNGTDHGSYQPKKPDFKVPEKYFFTIGVIAEKKNFAVLVDMMKSLPDYSLVMAGNDSTPYAKQIYQKIQQLGMEEKIIMPGKISDAQKKWLFEHCEAFFFPSKHEGFGLPVIEAMHYGKPVFISKCSSLPEIGGDMAFYWDSFNPAEMATVVKERLNALDSQKTGQNLKTYAARFSWKNNAETYLSLYQSIIGTKK